MKSIHFNDSFVPKVIEGEYMGKHMSKGNYAEAVQLQRKSMESKTNPIRLLGREQKAFCVGNDLINCSCR